MPRYDVAALSVFGSVARGDDTDESDVDLLYVLERGGVLLAVGHVNLEPVDRQQPQHAVE
ncbi:nucleotidyltransferase family protein [Frankia canadensis]|uniref:nucleotidyltransferase family protein n=1 Tax=Frankia canadensis TaxID=1836972 RepID=UPI001FB02ECB|nr:nucleotidyltransferase domain-containing protein [Frankia canadensis]